MADTFCSDFAANLLSNLVVFALGVVATWIVGKRLNIWEQARQRGQERAAEIEKGIRYLHLLKDEVADIAKQLPAMTQAFEATGFGTLVDIGTPCWDVLKPSGQLPKVIAPTLLQSLGRFYDNVEYVRRMQDYIARAWMASHPGTVPAMDKKLEAGVVMTLGALKFARDSSGTLLDHIDGEIKRLKTELDAL